MKSSKSTAKKSYYCSNCGKYGHVSKKCDEPITSLGVICVKFVDLPIKEDSFKKFIVNKYIEIDNFNFSHIDNINKLEYFKKNIKFLMIQRKHSLSYIEFIRGKYNINDVEHLSGLFKNMSPEEINNISEKDFNSLWNNLWKKTSKSKAFQKEYRVSNDLFQKLIDSNIIDKLVLIKPEYQTPEWGFPKGRRNIFEKNLECALRELEEETTLKNDQIDILHNINCVNEEYIGTNNLTYRHLYYLGYVGSDTLDESYFDDISNYEVGKIKWVSWDEASEIIRSYYQEKVKVVNMVYFLFLNLYIEYITKEGLMELS